MNDNEEEPRRETNYELDRRLRMERAKERYLEQHPFHRDREEINPIEVIKELSREYFEDNPEDTEFRLNKALLGSKLDKKATATEFLSKKLEADYDFIHNTKLGYLLIEKQSFQDFLKLVDERKGQIEKVRSINEEYPQLTEAIKETEESLKTAEGKMAELRSNKSQLESQIAKIEEEMKGLPDQIKALQEKNETLRAKNDKLHEEIQKEASDYQAEQKRVDDLDKLREYNRNWLFRRPIIPSDVYDDSIAMRLVKGLGWFCGYAILFYFIGWIIDYFI